MEGDGDTALLLQVFDQNNNLVGSDQCQYLNCVVSWYPLWKGNFYVVIRNEGGVYNEYSLDTN